MSFAEVFEQSQQRMAAVLRARIASAITGALAGIDNDGGGYCEHCPHWGECVICGQIHPEHRPLAISEGKLTVSQNLPASTTP